MIILKSEISLIKSILTISCLSVSIQLMASTLDCRTAYQDRLVTKNSRLNFKLHSEIQNYLQATINSLEKMRGSNHLVKDTLWLRKSPTSKINIRTLNENTSPTNIAIDLLIQAELISIKSDFNMASRNLSKVLTTLEQLQRHAPSGLFFSWYSTDLNSKAVNLNISSIDNMHLAIALWTIKETFPGTKYSEQARALLEPMNLSMFYDEKSGLIAGNYSYHNGNWNRDAYNFSNLGSEARILYSAGWSMGLFKDFKFETVFIEKAFKSLHLEVLHSQQGPLLKLWDGSAFQLFFPKIFISEESFSPILKKMYSSYGKYMIAEGHNRGLPVPAAHSPGVNKIIVNGHHRPFAIYNDKAGNKELVSTENKDVFNPEYANKWDQTFTPYALFMAATTNPEKYLPLIEDIKKTHFNNEALYWSDLGWLDGLNLSAEAINKVVPAQLAVNQGMIALSLLQMHSADGKSASGRALFMNQRIKQRMKLFYKNFDAKILQRDTQ